MLFPPFAVCWTKHALCVCVHVQLVKVLHQAFDAIQNQQQAALQQYGQAGGGSSSPKKEGAGGGGGSAGSNKRKLSGGYSGGSEGHKPSKQQRQVPLHEGSPGRCL